MGLSEFFGKNIVKLNALKTGFVKSAQHRLFRRTDAAPLALFRILFGILMFVEVLRYWFYGRIERYYIEPDFFFPFIEGIKPLGQEGMYAVFVLMGISAVFLAIGYYYRAASVSFFVLYTYVFLLDKTQYNNHYYLISLLAFLFIVTNANRVFSIDACRKKLSPLVPYWQVFIFRIQIFLVFFFAGIAKLNVDWLAGEPVRAWLADRSDYHVIGPLLVKEWFVYLYAYGGLLFDLLIGFILIWPPTRYIGLLFLIGFNLMNKWFYNIGIFPYLATAVFAVFMKGSTIRKLLRIKKKNFPNKKIKESSRKKSIVFLFVIIFILLQILIPLRHFTILGNVSWTDESHNFAWHMKLRDKDTYEIVFYTKDQTGQTRELPITDLTDRQERKMSTRPHMIIYYAHHLRDKLEEEGVQNSSIYVRTLTSLNSGPQGSLINESINLANEKYKHFTYNHWINHQPRL